jgi:hypothetical protein
LPWPLNVEKKRKKGRAVQPKKKKKKKKITNTMPATHQDAIAAVEAFAVDRDLPLTPAEAAAYAMGFLSGVKSWSVSFAIVSDPFSCTVHQWKKKKKGCASVVCFWSTATTSLLNAGGRGCEMVVALVESLTSEFATMQRCTVLVGVSAFGVDKQSAVGRGLKLARRRPGRIARLFCQVHQLAVFVWVRPRAAKVTFIRSLFGTVRARARAHCRVRLTVLTRPLPKS